MDNQEKLFNLQLLVQKLEEELQLYRNGTSLNELIEVIQEKDVELCTLQAKMDVQEEKLRKLAKTSGDVLIKYEKLQNEVDYWKSRSEEQEEKILLLQQNTEKLESNFNQHQTELESEINHWKSCCDEQDRTIYHLQNVLAEKKHEFDANVETVSKTNHEQKVLLETLQTSYQQLEEKFHHQQEELQSQITHWKTCCEEQDSSIASLQKRCAQILKDKNTQSAKLDEERKEMVVQIQQFRVSK